MFAAAYQIVLGGVTLLDFTDFTENEPQLVPDQVIQEVNLLRAAFSLRIPRGNRSCTLTFSRVKRFEDAASARIFKYSHVAALPSVAADCVLTVNAAGGGTTVITLANACLARGNPQMRVDAQLFKAHYQIRAGQITVTPSV